ncbi:hypothetical protein GFV14_00689 [Candidatus Hartigia pinicola]|nr:hypothetical protein GFV14_00689 [Candidatus Hartigia pinicola]
MLYKIVLARILSGISFTKLILKIKLGGYLIVEATVLLIEVKVLKDMTRCHYTLEDSF